MYSFYSAHDYDKNTMLDGLELMSAFAHNMDNYGDNETNELNIINYTGKIFI